MMTGATVHVRFSMSKPQTLDPLVTTVPQQMKAGVRSDQSAFRRSEDTTNATNNIYV